MDPSQIRSNPSFSDLVDVATEQLVDRGEIDVDALCEGHPELRSQLESILPTIKALADLGETPPSVESERFPYGILGDFRLLRELGRGGMGIVFEAEQVSLRRSVALKVLPFAALLDSRQLQRFKNEARAAATLRHPNIVNVYSVGCERGVHYYAMELVNGLSLDAVIQTLHFFNRTDETREPLASDREFPKQASSNDTDSVAKIRTLYESKKSSYYRSLAELGVQVANALEFAHSRGIVHRDIKPANLMLDNDGQLHITDFGLARVQTENNLTISGDLLGTLRYMSPEQLEGPREVDARSDIYALGATLYEFVLGVPLVGARDKGKIVDEILHGFPARPAQIDPHVPADLETILLKATSKEPDARFSSCQEFAEELERFVHGRPILARRATKSEVFFRWCLRHPQLSSLLSLVALLVVTLAIGGPWLAIQQRSTAQQLRQQLYDASILNAHAAVQDGDFFQARSILEEWRGDDACSVEWNLLTRQCDRFLDVPTHRAKSPRYNVDITPNGEFVAWGGWHSDVTLANAKDLEVQWRRSNHGAVAKTAHNSFVVSVVFFDNGRRLATGSYDRSVRIWDVRSGECLALLGPFPEIPIRLAACESRSLLAIGLKDRVANDDHSASIRLYEWEAQANDECKELPAIQVDAHDIEGLAFSNDGKWLAAACRGADSIDVWDMDSGERIARVASINGEVQDVCFSPVDLQQVVFATRLGHDSGELHIADITTPESTRIVGRTDSHVQEIEFHPDGNRMAVGTVDGQIVLFDLQKDDAVRFHAHSGRVNGLCFSPDGRSFYSASEDTRVCRWSVEKYTRSGKFVAKFSEDVLNVDIADDLSSIAMGCFDGKLYHWDVATESLLGAIQTNTKFVFGVAVSADGNYISYAGGAFPSKEKPGKYAVFRVGDYSNPILQREYGQKNCWATDFSPSENLVALTVSGEIHFWNLDDMSCEIIRPHETGSVRQIAFSEDGRHMASVCMTREPTESDVVIIDIESKQVIQSISKSESDGLFAVAIAGKANLVAFASAEHIDVHDIRSGKRVTRLEPHPNMIFSLDFTNDGERLISVGQNRQAKLWNVQSGSCLMTWNLEHWAWAGGFSPNDEFLIHGANLGGDGVVKLFDVRAVE